MSDLRENKTMRIRAHYKNELSLLELLIGQDDGYRMVWTWVTELLLECFCDELKGYLSDPIGILNRKIEGINDISKIFDDVCDQTLKYERYKEKYGISSKIWECGHFYQEIYSHDDEEKKELLVLVLSDYIKNIAPFIVDDSNEWFGKYVSDRFNADTKKQVVARYKKYAAKYKKLIKEFQRIEE
ncbi:hypothetical protein bpr_III102 [Butyrivibrio proteoclasticus B316]|uniref:Uncharacterized protein n=1 Tax=Butyrivibrio proteoclasticus (strain ATCC 51982 / DSM 14932 / B316) TaxID=515622 RepID=E0S308_BUTPB|nr:hypothetical protein [Butyrivibrio proteoclasticus]ADL35790.1 hypothetical protein bpr_III102 [Butyrivibrio proteoclasticus B316]